MKKAISIILVIIWMIIVFLFSSQIGDDSQVTSGNTIRKIITFFNENISNSKLEEIVEFLQPFIRKVAHFTLYTIGGFLIYNMFNLYNISNNKKLSYSILTGVLYSSSDELHQLFVPGRSGMITDVIIDSLGVVTGILIFIIILKIINKISKKVDY